MRKTMAVWCLMVTAAVGMGVSSVLAEQGAEPAIQEAPVVEVAPGWDKPRVQIAILLDTSGSMSGLIDQARTELWSIVNEFIFAQQNGRTPEVQVALYEYGNNGLARESGWIRQVVPLTTDLDKISEELFALTTNGGDEYCGWVIREATEKLAWSSGPNDLKVIFIAGNEPFTQGPVDYRDTCKAAVTKGIIVNTIHCGTEREALDGKWQDGAAIADGRHLNIDHNRQVVHVAAPQDQEIADLGVRLNQTYVPYGQAGQAARERQAAQDSNARHLSEAAVVQRAVAKSSSNYVNTYWDLVDAVRARQVNLQDIRKDELPENMQSMSPAERTAYVNARAKERAELQARIQQLNVQRNEYVAQEMQKQQPQGGTLGSAIKQAVREQAGRKNYTFKPADAASNPSEKAPEK
jgi:hypothetical protein